MWSDDNVLVTAGTKKTGNGVNAVLSLLQDLIAFQEKVGATVEAQDISENKDRLEDFHEKLGEMYTSLLEMAKGGVQSIRQPVSEMEGMEEEPRDMSKDPLMMNDNTIQQLP